MSDNTALNPGSLGDTIATEDISGVKYERVKLIDSTVGSTAPIGTAANPLPVITGRASVINSTAAPLAGSATWTGTAEDVSNYASATCAAYTDRAGTLYAEFSTDGTNWDVSLQFTVEANTNEIHRLTIVRKYFRARFVNGSGSAQTYLRLQCLFGLQPPLTTRMDRAITTEQDTIVTRTVINGRQENGNFVSVPCTAEGHLEVAIHGPLAPFGSIHAEGFEPVFQVDGVTGIDTTEVVGTTGLSAGAGAGSGANTNTNNMLICSTGTTQYSFASMQSRKRLRYRPGQGLIGRFAGLFSTPAADSIVVAGFGTAESGVYFGYNGTTFGILYSTGGVREIQTLTITTRSTTAENATVTLNGTPFSVAVTNAATATLTAYEISKGAYSGWSATQFGSTVVFLAASVGNKAGTFSVAGTTIVGSFAETRAGVAATDTWIPQTTWNGDRLDGSTDHNPSGITANWQRGNVFQIGIQYLGFGTLTFYIETCSANGNNAVWTTVHSIKLPNTLTQPSLSQPSFPYTQAAYSAGSTTNVSFSAGSFAGFIEGQRKNTGPRVSFGGVSTAVSTGSYYCIATIRNDTVYQGKANQSVSHLLSFGGAHDDATPVTLFLIRNATLVGTPNFATYATNSSCSVDTAATTCTVSSNTQIIVRVPIGQGSSLLYSFEDNVTIQPGETITIAAQTVTGTSTYTIYTLNTREDH